MACPRLSQGVPCPRGQRPHAQGQALWGGQSARGRQHCRRAVPEAPGLGCLCPTPRAARGRRTRNYGRSDASSWAPPVRPRAGPPCPSGPRALRGGARCEQGHEGSGRCSRHSAPSATASKPVLTNGAHLVHPVLLHAELAAVAVRGPGARGQLLLLEAAVLLVHVLPQLVDAAGRAREVGPRARLLLGHRAGQRLGPPPALPMVLLGPGKASWGTGLDHTAAPHARGAALKRARSCRPSRARALMRPARRPAASVAGQRRKPSDSPRGPGALLGAQGHG